MGAAGSVERCVSNHPFRPLRHRAVRLLWFAAVVSDVGTWVQLIVVGSLVAHDTGSAVQTGLVALATFMPQGIASPVGGLLADRYDRRKVFAITLVMQAVATGILATALGFGVRAPGVLTALILLSAAAGALGQPSYTAMQPDLVEPEELMAMISLVTYSWNSGRVIGPLLGTVLALAVGPAWTVAFNAVSFLVLATAVSLLRRPFRTHGGSDGSIGERLKGGWTALWATPGCAHTVRVLIVLNFLVIPFMGLIPIYARAEFHGGTGLAGSMASAQGVGSLLGGMTITVLAAHFRRSSLLASVVVLMSVMLALYGLAPDAGWVIAASVVLGAASSATIISCATVLQRDAPPASRGRVLSIFQAFAGVTYGFGLLFLGSIGDVANLRVAFVGGAVLSLFGCGALLLRSRQWRRAIDGPFAVGDIALATA